MAKKGKVDDGKNYYVVFFYSALVVFVFLDRSAIRRYFPAALLATVINTIIYQIAWV